MRERLKSVYLDDRGFGSGRGFNEKMVSSVPRGRALLDLSCGRGESRQLAPRRFAYEGFDRYADVRSNDHVDWHMRPKVIGDAYQLSIRDGFTSTPALQQVQAHLSEPRKALRATYHVFAPDVFLYVTVPFLHQIRHSPNAFSHYTPFSLQRMAEQLGSEAQEIRPTGGYSRLTSYALWCASGALSSKGLYSHAAQVIVGWSLAAFGSCPCKSHYLLDICGTCQRLAAEYNAIFRKATDG